LQLLRVGGTAALPRLRQLVAGHRRIVRAGSGQNLSRAGNIGVARIPLEELRRARDGKLLSHSDIDELIERNPL
jgi:hypothetical protein